MINASPLNAPNALVTCICEIYAIEAFENIENSVCDVHFTFSQFRIERMPHDMVEHLRSQ